MYRLNECRRANTLICPQAQNFIKCRGESGDVLDGEGKSLGQWISRNSPSPLALALGLGLCAKKVPLDPPKYVSQADADGRRMSRERDRDAAAMMLVVKARADRGGDRPTALEHKTCA